MKNRIRELRQELDLTMDKFAAPLGVGKTAISKIESGERNVTDQMVKSICREFNVSETWLRTGEGEMFVPRTRSQEITDFVGGILKGDDENFKRRFVSVLAQLDEAEWELIEKMAIKLASEETKKTEPENPAQP